MILAAQHFHLRQHLLHLAPFDLQLQQPPQDFKLPIDAGNREPGLAALAEERSHLVAGDGIER